MNRKIYLIFVLIILSSSLFVSCKEDELDESIFDVNVPDLDEKAFTYKFDKFLYDNFLIPYNMQFLYKMQHISTDNKYNLVPAKLENSKKLAALVKYLWLDAYEEIADSNFLKLNSPRIIHVIGSSAINPLSGTEIVGLAEGSIKISLFKVNQLNITDLSVLNENYFKTMHHEFAHILHQKKTYPREFNYFSIDDYMPAGWEKRHSSVAASLGFVSSYAGSETREDFVEVIANYIVKTEAQWDQLLNTAKREWKQIDEDNPGKGVTATEEYDGVDGDKLILEKLDKCRVWLKDAWGIDIDALRAEVQERQSKINTEFVNSLLIEYGIE